MPRFTIFTPTFNSERFVHRPFESVRDLACRDFEWIVIDDHSTDGTVELVRRLAATLDVEVRIVEKPENRGLFDSFARAVELARGEFFVGCAHDDQFDPDTLDFVARAWDAIPEAERPGYCAINVLCRSPDGTVAPAFPRDGMDSNAIEMYFRYGYRAESWPILRTAALREFPFPEGRRVGEGAFVWFPMAEKYRSRYFNRALRIYFTDNPDSITNRREVGRYSPDLADYNFRLANYALRYPLYGLAEALMAAARCLRFSVHAGRGVLRPLFAFRGAALAVAIVALPGAALLLAHDALRPRRTASAD